MQNLLNSGIPLQSREDGENKPAADKNGAEDGKTIIGKETAKDCSDEKAAIKKNLIKEAPVAKANLDKDRSSERRTRCSYGRRTCSCSNRDRETVSC